MSDNSSATSGSERDPDDDLSSSDQSSNNKTSSSSDQSTSDNIKKQLAMKETGDIFRLRVLVILILILAAAGVSVLVFLISQNSDEEEFETQFEGASEQLIEAFEHIKTDRISALSALAVAAIAHGVDHSRDWPFVALSSFQQRSFSARSNSGMLQVSINAWVNDWDREEWERYVVEEDSAWIQQAQNYQEFVGIDEYIVNYGAEFNVGVDSQPIAAYGATNGENEPVEDNSGPYLPFWEMSPLLRNDDVNIDILKDESHATHARLCLETQSVVLGSPERRPAGSMDDAPNSPTSRFASLLSIAEQEEVEYEGDPMTVVYLPIFDSFESSRKVVALMLGTFNWGRYFKNILPPNVQGIDVVLRNPCYEAFTYRVSSSEVRPLGRGDLHEDEYDKFGVTSLPLETGTVADGTRDGLKFHDYECKYQISVYPSTTFADTYDSSTPAIITFAVAIIFSFAILMFFVYDRLVERRQKLVLHKAVQSTAIVSSLFPKNVRDRLLQTANDKDNNNATSEHQQSTAFKNSRLKSLLGQDGQTEDDNAQPIADLFPNCTVLFADISGFTAWSSTREPAQVFTLLQSVYQAFDKVAARRRVFKVETIGDSYVAVTGLPEPQENHAVIMTKFSKECMTRLSQVTRELEVTLGPDTGDLSMRFGLHSGPVTAGVLRGDRARFQLFGDTVNTAARMESTGMRGRIQVSQSTADCLALAGKSAWLQPREDIVVAKGLGALTTYWADPDAKRVSSEGSDIGGEAKRLDASSTPALSNNGSMLRHERHVGWMVEVLSDYIKKIVRKRAAKGQQNKRTVNPAELKYSTENGKICLDEVVESLPIPEFDGTVVGAEAITLESDVVAELKDYVSAIAGNYRANPFHNFDHACHVTMSVHKLLNRVVTPDISEEDLAQAMADKNHLASRLHDYTHGINSDPLIMMAIVFSALIHDVDHRGVSNMQLGKEEPDMQEHYKKSIAEQNSLDVAWDLLMSDRFDHLRSCMFTSHEELLRFRQTIVNLVLATDIFDKELNDLRKLRWSKAFAEDQETSIDNNLRATIVMEHIIQASDVSHTMQHWHVYLKWNIRLFREMSTAFKEGRMGTDPASFWYEGELKFFDNYVIPLAKKLKECQVFGVSSDEYLNYAMSNRTEWEEKGKVVVQEMGNK